VSNIAANRKRDLLAVAAADVDGCDMPQEWPVQRFQRMLAQRQQPGAQRERPTARLDPLLQQWQQQAAPAPQAWPSFGHNSSGPVQQPAGPAAAAAAGGAALHSGSRSMQDVQLGRPGGTQRNSRAPGGSSMWGAFSDCASGSSGGGPSGWHADPQQHLPSGWPAPVQPQAAGAMRYAAADTAACGSGTAASGGWRQQGAAAAHQGNAAAGGPAAGLKTRPHTGASASRRPGGADCDVAPVAGAWAAWLAEEASDGDPAESGPLDSAVAAVQNGKGSGGAWAHAAGGAAQQQLHDSQLVFGL